MNAQRLSHLTIGSHRLPHDCKGNASTKPLHVTVSREGVMWVCHRCHASGGGSARPLKAALDLKSPPLSAYGVNLWETAQPLSGIAIDYLKARRCVIPPKDGALRWLPALKHPSGYRGPALVALCTDAITGEARTLHRTWIKADGTKADVTPPRLLLSDHKKTRTVIRLWPDKFIKHELSIAEGIETALCVAHGSKPVWSTIDAGNLAEFPTLSRIKSLLIFADYDQAGLDAARCCAKRWSRRDVSIVKPSRPGTDFCDELTL